MFETDIKEASRKGIMLHNRDGRTYWKLSLVCCRDGCENEVDMGECLCFEKEAEMVSCRDGHGMTCSTECWWEVSTPEQREKILDDIKKHNSHILETGDYDLAIEGTTIEMIDEYLDAIADMYDGSEFWEAWDIQECPV